MRLRRALLPALAVALAATTTATAAVKKPALPKACNLLTDPKNDGTSSNYPVITSAALDIQSGDIATGKSQLVAVLRVGSTNTQNDNWATLTGFGWSFGATLNGTDYDFTLYRPINHGPERWTAKVGTTNPPFTFAVEGNSFVWRIDRKNLPSLNKKPNQAFTQFHGSSDAFSSSADRAPGDPKKKYIDKQPSCVGAK